MYVSHLVTKILSANTWKGKPPVLEMEACKLTYVGMVDCVHLKVTNGDQYGRPLDLFILSKCARDVIGRFYDT